MQVFMRFKHSFLVQGPDGLEVELTQSGGVIDGRVRLVDKNNDYLIIENQPHLSESMSLLQGGIQKIEVIAASIRMGKLLGLKVGEQ